MFFIYPRALSQLLRRHARFKVTLVKSDKSPQLVVLGSGTKADGKSAVLVRHRGSLLINCPESACLVLGLTRIGKKINNLLLTRPHWNNSAGLSSFLHQYFLDQDKEQLKIFGIKDPNVTIPARELPRKLIDFQPIETQREDSGVTVRSFQLEGGTGCQPTTAYHLLIEKEFYYRDGSPEIEEGVDQSPYSVLVLEVLNDAQIQSFTSNRLLMTSLLEQPPDAVLHFSQRHFQESAAFRRLLDGLPASCQHLFLDGERPSFLDPCWVGRHVVKHFFQNRRTYPLPPTLQSPLTEAQNGEVWRDLSSKDWSRLSAHVDEMRQWIFDKRLQLQNLFYFPGGLSDSSPPILPPTTPHPAPVGRPNCWSAHSLLTYHLEGSWSDLLDITRDVSRLLAASLARNLHCEIDDVRRRAEELGRRIQEDTRSGAVPAIRSEFPKVIFLGTASANAIKHRNVTGILLRVDKNTSVLLDCGIGTLGRMLTFLGESGTREVLRTLKAVCVTHDHADHIEGLPTLMAEWSKVNDNRSKLPIYANFLVHRHISHNIRHFYPDLDTKRFVTHELRQPGERPLHPIRGLKLEFTYVRHKKWAFGFGFRHVDGWHVVFSGDTMPCQNMVRLGRGCDLLIHEATHEDEKEHLAVRTKHSTLSQAISVARKMKAKRVVLTHFSPRSEKFPVSLNEVPDHVVLASDGLQLSLDDVHYFRGDQVKTLANFITFSFSIGNYQFFSDPPTFLHPPRRNDQQNKDVNPRAAKCES